MIISSLKKLLKIIKIFIINFLVLYVLLLLVELYFQTKNGTLFNESKFIKRDILNKIEKDNGTYQDTYAWVLYQLNEYEMAKEWILKSLANGGDSSAVVVEHYGDILYQLGDKEGAINEWKRANKLGKASKFLFQKIEEEGMNHYLGEELQAHYHHTHEFSQKALSILKVFPPFDY